jgi:hypothetical protein
MQYHDGLLAQKQEVKRVYNNLMTANGNHSSSKIPRIMQFGGRQEGATRPHCQEKGSSRILAELGQIAFYFLIPHSALSEPPSPGAGGDAGNSGGRLRSLEQVEP